MESLYCVKFSLQENAFEELVCFQRALRELISATDAVYAKQFEEFFVGLEGRFVDFSRKSYCWNFL